MNIGELKLNGAGVYMGRIQTATLDLAIGLRPVQSANPAAPKYDVMVRAKSGQFLPIGGLWEKTATNGGGTFLQGQIDDPSFEAPLSIALFTQPDTSLAIAWSRLRRRAESGFADASMSVADDRYASHDDDHRDASPFGDLEPGYAKAA